MDKNAYLELLAELEKEKVVQQNKCVELERQYNEAKKDYSDTEIAICVIKSKFGNQVSEGATFKEESTNKEKIASSVITGIGHPDLTTFGDASEKILENAGNARHVSYIAEELIKLGKLTENRKTADSLRTDAKRRFINLGNNIWDLRRRHPQSEQSKS